MACGAAEQLGVVWWVVWVVWGCGLAVGGSFLSRSLPPWKGAIKGGETGQKKDMCVAWLGKKGPGCRNPGRVRLDLEILPCVLWGKGPPEGAGIQAGCRLDLEF